MRVFSKSIKTKINKNFHNDIQVQNITRGPWASSLTLGTIGMINSAQWSHNTKSGQCSILHVDPV